MSTKQDGPDDKPFGHKFSVIIEAIKAATQIVIAGAAVAALFSSLTEPQMTRIALALSILAVGLVVWFNHRNTSAESVSQVLVSRPDNGRGRSQGRKK